MTITYGKGASRCIQCEAANRHTWYSLQVLMRKEIMLEGVTMGNEDVGNVQYAPVFRR